MSNVRWLVNESVILINRNIATMCNRKIPEEPRRFEESNRVSKFKKMNVWSRLDLRVRVGGNLKVQTYWDILSSTLNKSEIKQRSVFRQRNEAIFYFSFNFLWLGTRLSHSKRKFSFIKRYRCRPKVFPRLAETICRTLQRNVTVKERLVERIHLLRFSLSFCTVLLALTHCEDVIY